MLTTPVEAVQKLQVTLENVEKALRLGQRQAARVAEIQKVQVAVLSRGLGISVQEFDGWLTDAERRAEAVAPLDDEDLEYRNFGKQVSSRMSRERRARQAQEKVAGRATKDVGFAEDGPDAGAPTDGAGEEEAEEEGQGEDEEDGGMKLVDEADVAAMAAAIGKAYGGVGRKRREEVGMGEAGPGPSSSASRRRP